MQNVSSVLRDSHTDEVVFEVGIIAEGMNPVHIGEKAFQLAGRAKHDGLSWTHERVI